PRAATLFPYTTLFRSGVSAAIGAWSLALGAIVEWWRGWSPRDWWGMSFGIAATAIMIVAALYPLRRRLAVWPLRTAQAWLQFHRSEEHTSESSHRTIS